jgi:hypothetical protein
MPTSTYKSLPTPHKAPVFFALTPHFWLIWTAVSGDEFTELARAFKRINAPVRDLGLTSLRVSTTALEGNTSTYNQPENDLASVTSMRDALANQLSGMLEDAKFHGQRISKRGERILDSAADRLLDYVHRLAH